MLASCLITACGIQDMGGTDNAERKYVTGGMANVPDEDTVNSIGSALSKYIADNMGQEDILKLADKKLKSMYDGKKLSILGDSISTYENWIPSGYVDFFPLYGEVQDVDEMWWKRLLNDSGMEMCADSSSAGSTCVGDSLSPDDPKFACSDYRIEALAGCEGVYPDVIIVYVGTNDLLTSVPLGENDGTQAVEEGIIENFSDAYSLMLDKIESRFPAACIFCCTLTQIGDWGTADKPFVTFVNSLGLKAEDYSKRIELIAGNKGLGIINLTDCGITDRNMHNYVTDGVHLNTEGMRVVGDVVKAALRDFQ